MVGVLEMNEQTTFYGSNCECDAINRLTNLEKCYTILNASLKTYEMKTYWGMELRCRLKVRYKR